MKIKPPLQNFENYYFKRRKLKNTNSKINIFQTKTCAIDMKVKIKITSDKLFKNYICRNVEIKEKTIKKI